MLTLALGAVIATTALPAFSQDNFPDTPENHWAYEALGRMRAAGLLVGYPDGLFRGSRPASRYEMAVALHALYQHLKGLTDGLEAQHNALAAKVNSMSTEGFATKDELRQVQEALATTKAALDGMKAWGDDIAALKRMTQTFERELASMGVDVEAIKKSVQDLEARVTALEGRKPPVDFSGSVDMAMIGAGSKDMNYGMTVDGRPTGVGPSGEFVGGFADNQVYHMAAFQMKGTNETGPKWRARMIAANTMGGYSFGAASTSNFAFGNQSWVFPGQEFGEAATEVWMQRLEVSSDTSLWGQNFSFRAGRVGHKLGNWFFRRIDSSPYFWNEDWDNGEWTFDGAVFDLKLGSANLNVFGGRQSERYTTDWNDINPMWGGNHEQYFTPGFNSRPFGVEWGTLMVDQHLGASLGIPLSDRGNITLNYLIGDSNSTVGIGNSLFANKVIVFGGEAKFKVNDRISIYGGYSQSNLADGNDTTLDQDNAAYWASIGYKSDRWGLSLGYQSIDPLFGAPGDWGRIGAWWLPTGIQGCTGKLHFNLSDKLQLMARGGFFKGRDVEVNGDPGMSNEDKVSTVNVSLNYKMNENWNLMLGGEFVNWDLQDQTDGFSGGKPTEKWYRLGLKYRFTENVWWSFLWEISDYDNDGVGSFQTPWGANEAKGYIFATQFGIKF
jgi:hypothetical protein